MEFTDYAAIREKKDKGQELTPEEVLLFKFRLYIVANAQSLLKLDLNDENAAWDFMSKFQKSIPMGSVFVSSDMLLIRDKYIYVMEDSEKYFIGAVGMIMERIKNKHLGIMEPVSSSSGTGPGMRIETPKTNPKVKGGSHAAPTGTQAAGTDNAQQANKEGGMDTSFNGALNSILGQFG